MFNRNRINKVREEADVYVQSLNDRYTNPSGQGMIEVQTKFSQQADEKINKEASVKTPAFSSQAIKDGANTVEEKLK